MTSSATAAPDTAVDVVCLGESMVTFAPDRAGRLADVPAFHRGIGGAESNVACYLARAGHTARWISRVGADGFGDHLLDEIAAAGVDVRGVQRDPGRPTGVYFKERRSEGTAAVYYRAGSAAAAMSRETVHRSQAWSGRILHLSGITSALSASCHELMRALTTRSPGRPLVSFDVNYRPALWPRERADGLARPEDPWVLAELARGCDLVFVGEDEAAAAWGLAEAAQVRAALPEPRMLVIKQGSRGATAYARRPDGRDAEAFQPALRVEVVEPVGAGDAFAAGFLSATLRRLPVAARLRHGHVMAAAALTVPADLGPPPPRAYADRLVALDEDAWHGLRLGPGWTEAALERDGT